MTIPPSPASTRVPWYVRPGIVLPIIGGIVVFTALMVPERIVGRAGDGRLTTNSTQPQGAGLFYDLARRLGWRVERRVVAEPPADRDVIHAVLDPSIPLRMGEAHALLEDVRNGAALLVVLHDSNQGGDVLGDSLRIATGFGGYHAAPRDAGAGRCKDPPRTFTPLWPDNRVHLYALRWKGPPPDSVETFLSVDSIFRSHRPTDVRPAAVGFPFGRGRIVVASDPDLLRNDAIRVCGSDLDVPAVRMVEYLRDGAAAPRRRIVFDEFHHGYGAQPGTLRAAATYLGRTPSGHVLFQLLGAGLVLLMAVAPRAIPPHDADRIERRSPLEHVDALARAYAQVGATRTATGRLLRGMRRRVEHGTMHGRTGLTDDAFLDRAVALAPAAAADVALIRRALTVAVSRHEFVAVGAALQRLETSLTRI